MLTEPVATKVLNDRRVQRAMGNPNRQRLVQILEARDYVSTTELLAQSNLAWGTLLYHLDILLRANLIGTSLAGKKRVYFRKRGATPHQLALEAQLSPNLRRIINVLVARTGRCQHEFQEATGLSQRMCSYYLQKLTERGFVLRQADGNRARYHPTPQLIEAFPEAKAALVQPTAIPVSFAAHSASPMHQ